MRQQLSWWRVVVVFSVFACVARIHGQGGGTVNFNNYVPSSGINAPVFDLDGVTKLSGTEFLAQLYSGPGPTNLVPVGVPVSFRTGAASGYLNTAPNATRVLPNVAPNEVATLQVRVWEASYGASFDYAAVAGGRWGESAMIAVVTGGVGEPPSLPADMVGLKSFRLQGKVAIVSQPVPITSVFETETVILQVSATGSPPLSYQWSMGGTPIPGATNSTLVMANIRTNQAGPYVVTVSDGSSSATSAFAMVLVSTIPVGGSIQFLNRIASAGLDAPVLAADGSTPLAGSNFVAQLHASLTTNDLVALGPAVPFLTGADAGYWGGVGNTWLTIPGVTPGTTVFAQVWVWEQAKGVTYEQALAAGGQVGKSDVLSVVTGGLGAPSNFPAPLAGLHGFHLQESPRIIAQPQNQSVVLGQNVVFSIGAVGGADPLSYQWLFNGTNIEGAVGGTLTLTNVQFAQAGQYEVMIGNALGTVTSASATLTVTAAPGEQGTLNFNNFVPASGVDAPVFDVDGITRLAGGAYLAQLYAGASVATLVPIGPAVPFRTGAAAGYWDPAPNAVRTVAGVAAGTLAEVEVRAWQSAAGTTYDAALAAGGRVGVSKVFAVQTGGSGSPPSVPADLAGLQSFSLGGGVAITKQPEDAVVFAGQPVELSVGTFVQGGTASYQWRLNGTNLTGAVNSTLSIPSAQLSDSGVYSVLVTSGGASLTSRDAVVAVLAVPSGATILFRNLVTEAGIAAPVFDVNGLTILAGTNFLAELYAGTNAAALLPLGPAVPFGTGSRAGYLNSGLTPWREVPDVAPGQTVSVQLRVWETSAGASYEQAQHGGGKVGESGLLTLVTGGAGQPPALPTPLTGLTSFRLEQSPEIIVQPTNQFAFVNQSVSFAVVAQSSQPIGYQWRFNGVALPFQTNAVLTITQVSIVNQGIYSVVASNQIGWEVSLEASMTVGTNTAPGRVNFSNKVPSAGIDAPIYDSDGLTRLAGSTYVAELYAGASADALLPVGGAVGFGLGPAAGYIASDPAPTRLLPGVQAGQAVFAQVRVWDSSTGTTYEQALSAGGKTGKSQVLAIIAGGGAAPDAVLTGLSSFQLSALGPVITVQPIDQLVIAGEPATFSVVATGPGGIEYQWQWLNGGNQWQPLSGATMPDFTLTNVLANDIGSYRAVVTGSNSVYSRAAQLILSPIVRAGAAGTPIPLYLKPGAEPTLVIEVSSDLTNWQPLSTVTNADPTLISVLDQAATNLVVRFYRVRNEVGGQVMSAEVAGAIQLRIRPGFTMVALPLTVTNATVASVFEGMPEGTLLYRFDNGHGSWSISSFVFGAWDVPDTPLIPGEGILVFNPTTNTYFITVQGGVPQGNLTQSLPAGWSIVGSAAPDSGQLDTALHFPVLNGDLVYRYDPASGNYTIYQYGPGGWVGGRAPVLGLGEAFWIKNSSATVWQRTFSSGN